MIIDRIMLHDFGVYGGIQKIDLTPPSTDKPIVLFSGLNGAGKTTLMDALQLCLLGSNAKCAGRNGGSYKDFLARSVHKNSKWGQASVEVIFRCVSDGVETRYRVTRTWKNAGTNIKEKLEVTRNKSLDKSLTENWPQYINGIMPANIAHLFFFDGEKIETYASPDGARELVSTGIYNLFGIDVIERLQKDLRILERRKINTIIPTVDKTAIRQKEKELNVCRGKIEQMVEKRAVLQTRELDVAKRSLTWVLEEYQARGGELRERREEIERRISKVQTSQQACNARMIEFASGELPLILVQELLLKVARYAEHEQEIVNAKALVKYLHNRDTKIIQLIQKLSETTDVADAVEKFCQADLEKQRQLASDNVQIKLSEADVARLNIFLDSGIPNLKKNVAYEFKKQKLLSEEMEAALLEQAGIPSEDSIEAILNKRQQLSANIALLENEIANIDSELEKLRQESSRLEAEINALWEKNAELDLSRKDIMRFTRHSKTARKILAEFGSEVLNSQINRVEQLALDSFQSLLHKDKLISELSINPESFNIVLRDMEQTPILPEQLSAGERQLLAVSLLWGMAKASGKLLPVAIDTPMGRLDSNHRVNLVDRYFPHASHQSLLFTTDEEIFGDYLHRLSPWVGRSYHLNYDNTKGSTTVSEGYFD
ncbi:MAG: DNA sulfur modification protein DndD [Gammaproteobacteria bacterium]|nr:DNA sulfur modification protein DndD [Gammaproteobacteria bacterium]MCY4282183.1 DNA sulfur modification protein DndD [Gammaproteobacteria bacterium]MCY4304746.1 DNA sulfur modification protein DndD [Aestuariivita sp.]